MNSQFFKPRYSGLIVLTIVLLALIFGCQISPRRVVVPGPSPTPTPNGSPTPTPTPGFTPTPTATPIPTGTPSPFGKTVPRAQQFLFLGDAGSPLLTGYKINPDGSLAPVPGSPFPINAPARSLKSLNNTLIVATEGTMTVYSVDKENGSLQS
ncbi:MAG TPA: hypothetical protein VE133_19430, partial [Candidatus Sulfotelmatobacter sp.]|nr:hypothetical protein [Candidatus Sulfotelmatobacter sp.]